MINLRDELAKKGCKGDKDRKITQEYLYWFGQTTCLRPVPNKIVEIFINRVFFIQASPNFYN